jgi:signal transduction histidine kinase
VLAAVVVGLIVVALVAAPIGWALAGRALRPLGEITSAAESATAVRLPGHGELGRYQEFAALSATLAGLYARLDAAYAAQRQFVAAASHELRTPLTVQRTLVQVALADPDADATSLRDVCAELLRNGDQLERLVAALLALALGKQGPMVGEPVDLGTLTAEAVTVRAAAAADLDVRTDIRPTVVAHADPALLTSLIGNLLDNAIRYNLDGGRVDVGTRRHGPRAVLEISNTGPAVPQDAVDRILQPFQRLAAPRTQGASSGLGLGLAIVHAVADSHGADLRVTPNPGGGLTVTVGFAAV